MPRTVEADTEAKAIKPIHMLMEQTLLDQIEEFRFKHRFHTRVETIKALLKLGLETDKKTGAKGK
jgi:metal-responsive CopG/Arc/MetJ family transcriptional regulator